MRGEGGMELMICIGKCISFVFIVISINFVNNISLELEVQSFGDRDAENKILTFMECQSLTKKIIS